MGELIKVEVKNDKQVVSARELHRGLELTTRFSKWVTQNFYMFVEGVDFTSVTAYTVVNNGAKRKIQDYALTVSMAKELSMMSRTSRGQEFRRYFIAIEDKWNSPLEVVKRGYGFLMKENEQLKLENQQMQAPAILGQAVSGSNDSISMGDFAKVLKQKGVDVGRNRLFGWMRKNGYLITTGRETNSPTQKAMKLGVMEVRETVITTNHGSKTRFTPLITGKGQQYFVKKFLKVFDSSEVAQV